MAKKEQAKGGGDVSLSDQIKSILSAHLSVEPDDLTDSTSFDDLNADSLDVVEIIMALEEEFDLEIPDEDAEKIRTVGDVTEYIKERIN